MTGPEHPWRQLSAEEEELRDQYRHRTGREAIAALTALATAWPRNHPVALAAGRALNDIEQALPSEALP